MVSQRQRLARKRYKAEHPELFPKPEPTPPKDPNKKKKKKMSMFKRKRRETGEGPKKKGFRKHPLRVPGMKPGDSCFICKAKDHIAKACPQKAEWDKNKICLLCKQRGHTLKRCPNKSDDAVNNKLCYNCGETGHSLSKCPHPLQDGGTKFASCFVCNQRGHLSKECPKNSHGIYPKGGCCKICGGVTHLAKDCPDKLKKGPTARKEVIETGERPRGQITKFVSGDELDDDFTMDCKFNGQKDKVDDSREINVKPKKKQGPKVGGCCKLCGGVTHLAKDCSDKLKNGPAARKEGIENGERPRGQITKFVSGDELDGDFTMDYKFNSQKDKVDHSIEINVKPKKKQGPKVVNFT